MNHKSSQRLVENSDEDFREDFREDFCPPCLAIPVAVAGAGAMGAGSGGANYNTKRILFWIGLILTILSVAFVLYVTSKGGCSSCKAKATG